MRLSKITAGASSESGAVLVIVGAAMLAIVLIAAFVIDAANWYEHKRHLQTQADAAALAGAQSFTLGNCSDSLIEGSTGDAHRYGGSYFDQATGAVQAEPYNNQVGGADPKNIHILINSAAYYGDAGAGDNSDPNGSPCTAKYIDVKATETNLPWFFGFFGARGTTVNAHARVGLVQENQASGTLPIAVPNPLPTAAAAIFIDEANNDQILRAVPLSHVGTSGSLDMWSNGSAPAAVTNPSRATGIVIALTGRPAASFSLSGGLAAICDQALTDCYDASADPPTNGVSFIRGYAVGGSGAQPSQPILRSVELFPGTTGSPCSNPYFSSNTSDCTYDFVARIDAGTNLPKADQIYAANGIGLTSSTDPNCAFVAGANQCWHANLTLTGKSGPNPISVTWEETSGCLLSSGCSASQQCRPNGNRSWCSDTFPGPSQRAYSAKDSTSGPIKLVNLCNTDTDPSCATSDSQSYPAGSNLHLVVTVGIGGTLKNATDTNDPLVSLRIVSNTGQSLNCDPGYTNLKQELANGCRPSYIPNTGTPDCSTVGTSALWASPQPWSCVAVSTGRQPNDVAAGLNLRIFGDERPPNNYCPSPGLGTLGYNNWSMFVNNYAPTGPGDPRGQDGFPVGDPRVLDAYITTYGAFSHVNGTSGSVPVIGFGHFYVTGYTGNGGGFDPPNTCNSDAVPNNDSGLIVGHFIRYIDTVGGTGTAPCDPNSINACVIVMTK